MFYLRREREERARGAGERAALETAAATSGRAVLVSGITVATAMAGMYFAGAATFESFASGTILVVAIAVIGSLTVLAVLSKLGDRVNKARVPLLTPPEERVKRESRVWNAVLNPVLRRPAIAAALHGGAGRDGDPGVRPQDGGPRDRLAAQDLQVIQTYDRIQAAFPGNQIPAEVVIERRDASQAEVSAAVRELRAETGGSDLFEQPLTVDVSPDRRVTVVEVPIAGDGTNDTSYAALRDLRDRVLPTTVGEVSGRRPTSPDSPQARRTSTS